MIPQIREKEDQMIIDCHYHLDERVQPLENLLLKMDQNGIEKIALMPNMNDPIPHTPEFLLKMMRFFLTHRSIRGLAKKLAAKFTPEGDLILPKDILTIYKDPENGPIADTIAAHPDRFLGWVFVNPRGQNDPVDEYEKWIGHEGYIGVKAHPFWHQFSPRELLPVAEKVAAAGKPLLIHAGFDSHGDFLPLIDELPELKLILAHTGFPEYADTWKLVRGRSNVWLDLSADAYVNAKTARAAVEYVGVDQCLFGSDGPYGTLSGDEFFDNGHIKRRIEKLFPDERIQKKLLGDNFSCIIS